jgi:hypothetical protein
MFATLRPFPCRQQINPTAFRPSLYEPPLPPSQGARDHAAVIYGYLAPDITVSDVDVWRAVVVAIHVHPDAAVTDEGYQWHRP